MLKKILLAIWIIASCVGIYWGIRYYNFKKEQKRRDAYYQNLKDTSSPTVTSLRDSILITYQEEKRDIHIYVPPGYDQDTLTRYPVIYMMDGESSFNDLENMGPEWEIDEVFNQAAKDEGPTAIVVGIVQSDNRDAEYTPWINEDNPDAHGDKYTTWVATELKPWIDANYRTDPSAAATTIGGISRSGMMAYYMMMAYPDIFGVACIQSPAMWVDYDRLMAMELNEAQLNNKRIFVSVGEKETDFMIEHAQNIYDKFKALGLDARHLDYTMIKGEGHWHLTWRKSFVEFYDWWK